ncbi:Mini-ribonuclease 3 [Thermoanaerobacter kivui]|uniref:Mini-ribonuclease 3 n=1 Tax=Thermoanaerobacter kivui TaxID=2325 RepID=UPI000670D391
MFYKKGVLSLSPLVLAFIGDSVYDLYIRTMTVNKSNRPVHFLNKETVKYVKAKSQANAIKRIYDFLTEEEKDIVKRGRNVKSATIPKNADVQDYRYATAFEALIGYLYLTKDFKRLEEILKLSVQFNEE